MNIQLEAYAKINLYLDITAKRANGYHDIKGIMHKIPLSDTVSVDIEQSHRTEITLTCSAQGIPTDSTNIAYRAAQLYIDNYTNESFKVAIHIEKRIPAAGGLAGGSTDGAAVLIAMHRLLGKTDIGTLIRDSVRLGADVPFCMTESAMITEGIGDILTPCSTLPDCAVLICNTGESVSTVLAYSKLDEIYGNFIKTSFDEQRFSTLVKGLECKDLKMISSGMYNIFEEAVLRECPLAKEAKNTMLRLGAVGAMMSGSGSTVFGLYPNEESAREAYTELHGHGYTTHICKYTN